MVLAKPRHDEVIKQMHNLGIRVMAIPDGDVAASSFMLVYRMLKWIWFMALAVHLKV